MSTHLNNIRLGELPEGLAELDIGVLHHLRDLLGPQLRVHHVLGPAHQRLEQRRLALHERASALRLHLHHGRRGVGLVAVVVAGQRHRAARQRRLQRLAELEAAGAAEEGLLVHGAQRQQVGLDRRALRLRHVVEQRRLHLALLQLHALDVHADLQHYLDLLHEAHPGLEVPDVGRARQGGVQLELEEEAGLGAVELAGEEEEAAAAGLEGGEERAVAAGLQVG